MAKEKVEKEEKDEEKKTVKVTAISPFSMGGVKFKKGDILKVTPERAASMKGGKLIA